MIALPAKKESKQTFEQRLAALEALVEQMENGGMTLADTIKAYEKGIKLSDSLQKDLTAAQERLTVLHGQEQQNEAEEA